MAGLLPPAPMPCRGAKHSGARIDVEQLHRLAPLPLQNSVPQRANGRHA
jgi:hypothetical protein